MMFDKKVFFLLLAIIFVVMFFTTAFLGPLKISLIEMIGIVSSKMGFSGVLGIDHPSMVKEAVFWNIRLPRVFLGILVGIALGTSGAILQGLFRNPLVDPGFIGVSSGAALAALLVIMFSGLFNHLITPSLLLYVMPVCAMIGSIITTLLVFKISVMENKTNIMMMLLSGIAINALVGSIIGLLVFSSDDQQLRSFTFWTLGGLDRASWEVVGIASTFILLPLFSIYSLGNPLDIFMLGDSESSFLGLDVEALKRKIILFSALMVGVSVAFCGMIGFVGLVTPHLVRLFIGPSHKFLVPGSALLGAIILLCSDLLSRVIVAPAQLPIGIITSSLGSPFFIYLLISQKKKVKYGF